MKSNVSQAVQSYISWKQNGGRIETDRINTEEVAQKLAAVQKQAEVMQLIEKEVQISSTGEKVGVALGQLTNGLIKAFGAFTKEVGKGINTYVQTTKGNAVEDVSTLICNAIREKKTVEINMGTRVGRFVEGEFKGWK